MPAGEDLRRCAACHGALATAGCIEGVDGVPYCSEWCYRTRTAEEAATLTDEEMLPLWRGMMRTLCKVCPNNLKIICLTTERPTGVAGKRLVGDWKSMPWDNMIEGVVAWGLSDGSVPEQRARAVVAAIEDRAHAAGHAAVRVDDVQWVITKYPGELNYRQPNSVDPAFLAALQSLPDAGETILADRQERSRRTKEQRDDPEARKASVDGMRRSMSTHQQAVRLLDGRPLHWCGHSPHFFARMLMQPGCEEAKILQLEAAAEGVAAERGHPGVTPRDLHTAWFRAVADQA